MSLYDVNDIIPSFHIREYKTKNEVLSEFQEKEIITSNNYPQHIIDVFNNNYNFEQIPIHNLGKQIGVTGYLDFLSPSDLNSSVVQGCDCFGRPFIALRIQNNNKKKQQVFTIFKRYSGSSDLWVLGTKHPIHLANGNTIGSGTVLQKNNCIVLDFVKQLLQNSDTKFTLV